MSTQVQETNDFSIASKYSMVNQGYFKDVYMKYLSPKQKRRSPLINIGYYVRAVVVNEGINICLDFCTKKNLQIVSLGAGFDTTYFRLIHGNENISYFEIDLHEVVKRKIEFIKKSKDLINKLINVQEFNYGITSKNYSILSQDLNNFCELESVLTSFGFDINKPTLFLSECAITYMAENSSTAIINWASKLQDVVFMVYEQINPDDGFGQVMMKHFGSIDSPLKSVVKYKTKQDQINRYKSCGFPVSYSVGAFEIYKKALTNVKHNEILNLEPFDEWEEWHLTSCHYTLSVGSKGIFEKPVSNFFSTFSSISDLTFSDPLFNWELLNDVKIKLYAHSVLPVWNSEAVLVVGGFGLSCDNQHKRLCHTYLYYLKTNKIINITPPVIDGITWDCMYHSCSLLTDSDNETRFLLYGGRKSPMKNVNSPGFVISIRRKTLDNILISGRKIFVNEFFPEVRRRHCSVQVDGGVFMCGGLASVGKPSHLKVLGDAWYFTHDEQWVKIESRLPPRFSHSAVCHNNTIFITGGLSEEFKPLNDIWSYSLSDNIWNRYDLIIIPRYSHTSHFIDDMMILIGGINDLSESQPGISVINLKDKIYSEFKLPKSTEKTSIMLHNHASILISELDCIYIIGGGGNCFSFGTSFNSCVISLKLNVFLQNK